MKLASIACAPIAVLGVVAFSSAGTSAVNNTTTRSNTQHNVTAGPATTCPAGEAWDATAKKCVATSGVNYNSSKSNSGNVTAPPPTTTTTTPR